MTDTSLSHGRTLAPGGASDAADTSSLTLEGEARYLDLLELGAGGMGEVRLVKDQRLLREVALKRMRRALAEPEYVRRFLREVRVQGQLDHPAVVPVYDLGLDAQGDLWFTMKRIRGLTLAQVVDRLRDGDPETARRFTRYRLLSLFTTVCACVESAHARGVLHRDLKPGNVMVGEFDEVHVLDWGLARVRGTDDEVPVGSAGASAAHDGTELGVAMGTPGYMSPEQAEGRTDELDARTDVYALGVILHELLFTTRLHRGDTAPEKLASTKAPRLPEFERREVPPELDAIWRRACAPHPEARYASASALAADVTRYLQGERDESRRKELAAEQLTRADQALSAGERGPALQALGRALAFEPTNSAALRKLATVLAEPPRETPPEAQATLDELARARAKEMTKATALRLTTWTVGLLAAAALLGVKSGALLACLVVLQLASAGTLALLAHRKNISALQLPLGLLSALSVALLGLALGPLVVVPALASTHAMLVAANAPRRHRALMATASVVAAVLPVFVTPLGSYVEVREGALVLTSPLLVFEGSAPLVIVGFSLLPIITPTVLVGRLRDAFVAAERAVVVQAAALRQLIP